METINKRIKFVVSELFRGSIKAMSANIQFSKSTIYNYIRDENPSKPTADILTSLVTILHIDAHWLLTGEGQMLQDENRTASTEELCGDYSKIICEKDKQIERLLTMLEDKDKLIAKLIDKN